MPYVRRSESGKIIAASNEPLEGACEQLAADAPELRAFIEDLAGENNIFESSDMKMIRAIEDVIDLLISKNVICITDLPAAVQSKLMERRSLRHSLNALNLIGEDEQGLI
ncbi:MAG: tryptophan synthase subunit beta like protein [Pseudomonadota bacterium]